MDNCEFCNLASAKIGPWEFGDIYSTGEILLFAEKFIDDQIDKYALKGDNGKYLVVTLDGGNHYFEKLGNGKYKLDHWWVGDVEFQKLLSGE